MFCVRRIAFSVHIGKFSLLAFLLVIDSPHFSMPDLYMFLDIVAPFQAHGDLVIDNILEACAIIIEAMNVR
jgi:hypothetical protein